MRFFMLIGFVILTSCGSEDKKSQLAGPATSNAVESSKPPSVNPAISPQRPTPPPANFAMPDFAPQYPGAKIQSVNSGETANGSNHEVTLLTGDDAAKVVDFYRGRFAAAGLRMTSDFMSGGTAMMSAIGKGRQASVAITKEQGHNAVIVTYSGE